jgi:hypothetical protein
MALSATASAAPSHRPWRAIAVDIALVSAGRLTLSAIVWYLGYHALSDDDFARTVIAQRFAEAPAWDPSGTSWLPLPFYVQGTVHAVFGSSLAVARATAWVLGIAAAIALYASARVLGLGRAAAIVAAVLVSLVPLNAALGIAAVPDGPVAALLVLAAALVTKPNGEPAREPLRFLLAALALALASASRYEAWPVSAAFVVLALLSAARARDLRFAGAGAIALVVPALWMLHGALHHGSALFFERRVTSYRAALGEPTAPFLEQLLRFPLALVRSEPSVTVFVLVSLALALATRTLTSAGLRRVLRPALLLGALLAFLVLGELAGSGATHHPERALLAIWLWLVLASAGLVATSLRALRGLHVRLAAASAAVAAVALAALVRQPAGLTAHLRAAEIAAGELARERVPEGEELLVLTPDYGYFAVMATFGRPRSAAPLADRDPRRAPSAPVSLAGRAEWLVLPAAEAARRAEALDPRGERAGFVLARLR